MSKYMAIKMIWFNIFITYITKTKDSVLFQDIGNVSGKCFKILKNEVNNKSSGSTVAASLTGVERIASTLRAKR